jgi:tetratricopeptide (TPR) repeat protein
MKRFAVGVGLISFLILGLPQPSLLADEYKDAQEAYERGRNDLALEHVIKKLRKDNDHKKAVELFKTVIKLVIDSRLTAAEEYEAREEWSKASREYGRLLEVKVRIASLNAFETVTVDGNEVKRPLDMPKIDVSLKLSNASNRAGKQKLYLKQLRSYTDTTRREGVTNFLALVGLEKTVNHIKELGASKRNNCVVTLGRMKDSVFVVPIITIFLNDSDASVRHVSIRALGEIGDSRAVEPLIDVLLNDNHTWLRKSAAMSLGMIRDPRAVEPLLTAMNGDQDSEVKDAAISALIEIKDPRCSDLYIKALTSDDSEARFKAAKIILDLKEDPKALEVKSRALEIIEYEESFITSVVRYGPNGRPFIVSLKNLEGELIAKRVRVFSESNVNIISEERIVDGVTNETIHIIKYEHGEPTNFVFLCLDKRGNLIRESGKPVLKELFHALQRTSFEKEYDGPFLIREIRKIYPCEDCAGQTGIKNCRYVW